MTFNLLRASGIRQLFGVFKTEYIPEEGESVVKVFRDVWNQTAKFTKNTVNDIVVTNRKMVISANTGGGYPGYDFYFDPSTKLGFFDDRSVIEEIFIEGNDIKIKCRGNFKNILLTDTVRTQEIYNSLQGQLASFKK